MSEAENPASPSGPERPAAKRRLGSSPGWGAAILLGPHLVFGTYLAAVPDRFAFLTAQVITLVHVVLALVSLPIAVGWVFVHARRMKTRKGPRQSVNRAAQQLLTTAAVVATLTGLGALYWGAGTFEGDLHTWTGLLVAVPLVWHLWRALRRGPAVAFGVLVPLALLLGGAVRVFVPPQPEAPLTPEFAYTLRPAEAFESAEWCGSCHVQNHEEWRQSVHGRTLELPEVKRQLPEHADLLALKLSDLGQVIAGEEPTHLPKGSKHERRSAEGCFQCHAPAAFFSDTEARTIDAPVPQVRDAIGCSFCHTLRAVHVPPPRPENQRDDTSIVRGMTIAVAAPETVRRYLGQASADPFRRFVGDLLIRWRPEMHGRDYRSPILDTAQACRVCHGAPGDDPAAPHRSWTEWAKSPFAHDPGGPITCQDCHMAAKPTGGRVTEPGRVVPWGRVHAQRRSHLLLGGNVNAQNSLGHEEAARLHHHLNTLAASVRVESATQESDGVRVRVIVRNELTGHLFPGAETGVRQAWVQLTLVDATGMTLVQTARAGMEGPVSPLLDRQTDPVTRAIVFDTVVPPREERTFETLVPLQGASAAVRVRAALFHRLDPEAIASAEGPVRPPG